MICCDLASEGFGPSVLTGVVLLLAGVVSAARRVLARRGSVAQRVLQGAVVGRVTLLTTTEASAFGRQILSIVVDP